MKKDHLYYDLIKSANLKNKTECEVYDSVSQCIDNITKNMSVMEKRKELMTLIAYFEGKSSRTFYFSITSLVYAIVMGVIGLLPSVKVGAKDIRFLLILLLIAAFVGILWAFNSCDFERKFVLCVLNYKLSDLDKEKQIKSNDNETNVEKPKS